MTDIPESNEVSAHQYRLAQTNRLRRFCDQCGVSADDVLAGRVDLDLDPICGPDGKIQPEAVDYVAARQ
jgi:hypothetical protein